MNFFRGKSYFDYRTKEIGVRKVLGASERSFTALLSRGFIQLVILAILIAPTLAGLVMHKWLHDFAYQVLLSWSMFVVSGLVVIFIALITVSFHSVKAAMSNPADGLQTQ